MKKTTSKVLSFPHMGNLYIPISVMLKKMGANIFIPPYNNKETLSIGTLNSCEGVCLPYKLNLGNYIQALEEGANVLIMIEAPGTCRLGNYAGMAESKLKELGYDFEMVVFDMYKGKAAEIIRKFSYATGSTNILTAFNALNLALKMFKVLDTFESLLFYYRPREIEKGRAEIIYQKARCDLEKVNTIREANEILKLYSKKFSEIEINKSKEILKVFFTGEFFVLLDTYTNMNIEKELGLMGVQVERQLMFSDWTNQILIPNWLNRKESHRERSVKAADGYMTRVIGGDCIESIGDTVVASKNNVDGVIHMGPFNCNPEIVSQCILPHVSQNESIPVISFSVDEQTGRAGLMTRLEAFVDLMKRRKKTKQKLEKRLSSNTI